MKQKSLYALVLSFFIFQALLCMTVQAANSPWQFSAKGTVGTNDNLGRAERSRDIKSDNFARINLGAAFNKQLSQSQSVGLRGFVETEQWDEVRGMSRVTAGGLFNYNLQFNPGPTAPFFQFNLGVQADDYDYKQRDSTIFTSQLIATKPLSEVLSASIGIEYRDRDSSGTVWDTDQVRGFLSGLYAFRPRWSAHGTYSYIDGDVWSTARTASANGTPADDIFGLVSAASAIEPDKAFNDAYSGSWHAYRLPAYAHMIELGINREFENDMVLDFSYTGVRVNARGNNDYDIDIFRVSLLKRF
jgi:hypothetical protein